MIALNSKKSADELIADWDDRTNPSRFSGHDDIMDICFMGVRKHNRIKLMKRTGISREYFSTVFRAKIIDTEQGGQIRGVFTKGIIDYIIVFAVLLFALFIYLAARQRQDSPSVMYFIMLFSIAMTYTLLHIRKGVKKSYLDFLNDIL